MVSIAIWTSGLPGVRVAAAEVPDQCSFSLFGDSHLRPQFPRVGRPRTRGEASTPILKVLLGLFPQLWLPNDLSTSMYRSRDDLQRQMETFYTLSADECGIASISSPGKAVLRRRRDDGLTTFPGFPGPGFPGFILPSVHPRKVDPHGFPLQLTTNVI